MEQDFVREGWRSLFKREWIPTLAILLGGVLLQSMNVLLLTTVLPSIVGELGGVTMLSWPTTAYLASSIVAASCVGVLATAVGSRTVYCVGVTIFALGALLCSMAPAMGWIVVGRLIQGFGGGLEAAVAYVLVRGTFPELALVTDDCTDVDQLEHVSPDRSPRRRGVRPFWQLAQCLCHDRRYCRCPGNKRLLHLAVGDGPWNVTPCACPPDGSP